MNMIGLAVGADATTMDVPAWVAAIAAAVAAAIALFAYFSARGQAKSAKNQADAAQEQAETAKEQAEAAKSQAESAKIQSESATLQADAAVRQTAIQEHMYRNSRQPYVWADVRADPVQGSLLQLVVRNEGPTVAEDVRISFDPPLQAVGIRRGLEEVQQQLSEGFHAMPPGREMAWYLAIGHRLFADDDESDVPMRYTVTINCRGPEGELPPLTYVLDLDAFKGTTDLPHGSLRDVTKAIEKVATLLGKSQ